MGKYTKQKIEESLIDLLDDLLRGGNQEGSIISLNYDEETELCTVVLSTHIVEEDDYIGFQGY